MGGEALSSLAHVSCCSQSYIGCGGLLGSCGDGPTSIENALGGKLSKRIGRDCGAEEQKTRSGHFPPLLHDKLW